MANIDFSPAIIKQMGVNAYSIPSAISELLANSLDANATIVRIVIDKVNERIAIFDNGHGMSKDVIENNFLLMASTKKIGDSFGNKGIGKLAAFAIGSNIEITTKTKDENANWFQLDYREIEKKEKITDYDVAIEELTNEHEFDHFTEIVITDITRQHWHRRDNIIRNIFQNFSSWPSIHNVKISIVEIDEETVINEIDFNFTENENVIFYSLDNESDEKIKNQNFNLRDEQLKYDVDKERLKKYSNYKSVKTELAGMKIPFDVDKKITAQLDYDGEIKILPKISGYVAASNEKNAKSLDIAVGAKVPTETEGIFKTNITVKGSKNSIAIAVNNRIILENIIPYLDKKNKISARFYVHYINGVINANFLGANYEGHQLRDIIDNNRTTFDMANDRFEYIEDLVSNLINLIYKKMSENGRINTAARDKWKKENDEKAAANAEKMEIVEKDKIPEFKQMMKMVSRDRDVEVRNIFVSHRSFSKEIVQKFMSVIDILVEGEDVKIFFTSSVNPEQHNSTPNLYDEVRKFLDGKTLKNSVMICFPTDGYTDENGNKIRGYVHNWNTDIEFGMGFQALSEKNIYAFTASEKLETLNPRPLSEMSFSLHMIESDKATFAGVTKQIQNILNNIGIAKELSDIQEALDSVYEINEEVKK